MNANLPIDPYLIWAQKTAWRDYAIGNTKSAQITVIAKLKETLSQKNSLKLVSGDMVPVSSVYHNDLPNQKKPHYIIAHPTISQLNALQKTVERFEISLPIGSAEAISIRPTKTAKSNSAARVIVGVIDDFIGFSHASLEGRFTKIWSQDQQQPITLKAQRWRACDAMGYGHELQNCPDLSDYPLVQKANSHGSHIASTLFKVLESTYPRVTDASVNVDAIGVHMPKQVLSDTSGGAMAAQILDGVHYILQQSNNISDHIVINISYGTYAGPHDGSSLLEEALDELIDAHNGKLQIVFPSGNQYEKQTHAKMSLKQSSSAKRLNLKVQPDDRTPSFVELWTELESAKNLKVTLISPSGKTCGAMLGAESYLMSNGAAVAGVIFPQHNAMSARSAGVLIAWAPTASISGKGEFAEHGVWCIQVETTGKHSKPIDVEAYVERDDAFGRQVRGRQAYFVDEHYEKIGRKPGQPADNSSPIKRHGSLNTVVTGNLVISAGSYLRKERRPSYYSGGGAVRGHGQPRPLAMADADDSLVHQGILGAGVFGVSQTRMSGTSVAAALVSGAIAASMCDLRSGKSK